METHIELANSIEELKKDKEAMPQKIIDNAKAEKDYRVAKAKRILELKKDGIPTTLIPDLAKGTDEVAELGCKRDIAKEMLKAGYEIIEVDRSINSSLKTLFEKEY